MENRIPAVESGLRKKADYRAASRLARLALWTCCAAVVAGLESFIPLPLPWIKLGLANGIALVVLWEMGAWAALQVNVFRVIVVAALLGSWSSPSFVLSLSGAVTAVLVMALVKKLAGNSVSMTGVSICGAWTHMATQFTVASLLIVRHASLMVVAGPSLVAALVSGFLVGWLAAMLLERLPKVLLEH